MLNNDPEGCAMQFEPDFLKITSGNTVTFVVTNKGRNSKSILTLTRQGAEPLGRICEKITVKLDTLDTAKVDELPGRAADRMAELIAEARGVATCEAEAFAAS